MTTDLLQQLLASVEARRPVVLATVVHTERSVPRRSGSKMLVYPDGTIAGSVGGGEMEVRVVSEAIEAAADGRPRRVYYALVDPTSGDPGVCGGTVELYLEPYMPKLTVFIVGAGHVGQAVAELASWLGQRVVLWDDRHELVTDYRPPPGTEVTTVTGPIAQAIDHAQVDRFTTIVMVTRNVGLDLELLPHLLATDAPYIGLMGSARRWETTRQKLADAGVPEDDLARITAPIGMEIAAETPSEIAVSIMAQIIARGTRSS